MGVREAHMNKGWKCRAREKEKRLDGTREEKTEKMKQGRMQKERMHRCEQGRREQKVEQKEENMEAGKEGRN